MIEMEDVDIRCGAGWTSIVERAVDDLNAAGLDVFALVAAEHHGRLRIDHNYDPAVVPFLDVARVVFLAECRSYYVCELCGRPGEHRANKIGWRSTRCVEHQPPDVRLGRLIYDTLSTPMRHMSDGKWSYDPVNDVLLHVSGPEYDPAALSVVNGIEPPENRPEGFLTPDENDH